MKNDMDLRDTRQDFPVHVMPRIVLFLLTVCCVASMGYYYLKKENITSFSQAAGLIIVPFQKGINVIGSKISEMDRERLELDEANAKAESLEAELEEAKEQIAEQNRMIYDTREVRKLLELKNTYYEYDTIGANVIFRDASSNWYSTFTIDQGSRDGIQTGMNVIADGGLVGFISDVSPNSSTVTSIINDNVNVSGMQLSTEESCIVIGDLTGMMKTGMLKLDYMAPDFDASLDTVIVTSRISDRYLPNIVIGYVTGVEPNQDQLTSRGYLRPAVDFAHLKYVLVIQTLKEIE